MTRRPGPSRRGGRSLLRAVGWRWTVAAALVVLCIPVFVLTSSGDAGPGPAGGAARSSARAGAVQPSASIVPSTRSPASASASAPAPPALGAYVGPGAAASAGAFDAAVGGKLGFAMDYLDGSSWPSIADPWWLLKQWHGTPYRMVWNVPILPPGATLARGATGAFDPTFAQLAQRLVAAGFGQSWLVVGYDPGASSAAWRVSTPAEAASYVAYWRQIVATMRAVPGAAFRFVWDVVDLPGTLAPVQVYPGNAYVDVVATDAFDRLPLAQAHDGDRWPALLAETSGPDWYASFAAARGKPLMVAKWGVVPTIAPGGGGDDPDFVAALWRWSAAHHVVLVVTWDYGTWAVSGGAYPGAMAALVAAAGSAAESPAGAAGAALGPPAGSPAAGLSTGAGGTQGG